MTPDNILKQAQEKTGLAEIDSNTWREGLEVILADLEDPRVTDGGRAMVLGRAVDALSNRLRVHDYVQQHPEVLDEEVKRPLFVLGMPRTGTTVVSFLLDQDPNRRSLLNWEAPNTVPPATTETLRTDPRCLELLETQKVILEFMKSTVGVPHWEFADEPTECMFVHDQDFKGLIWDAWTPTDRYAQWLMHEADLTSTYEYQKRVLQILQSTAPGIWSLKMPSHAVHVQALLTVFPDARLVWAHRDPYKATGSLCNLQLTPQTMVLGEEGVDRSFIGQNAKNQLREHVMRPLRVGVDRFFHLHYADLMRSPVAVMRDLYAWAGDEFTPEVEANMRVWLANNPQHKHGVSKYSLAEYGLTKDELVPVFAEYLAAVDIEPEGEDAV